MNSMNQFKTVIFISYRKEASGILFHSGLRFDREGNLFKPEDAPHIGIFITGIGKKATVEATAGMEFDGDTLIFKFGTCAVIDRDIPLLTPVIPAFSGYGRDILKIDRTKLPCGFEKEASFTDSRIYTSDHPVFDKNESQKIRENDFSLIDMETYHFVSRFPGIIPVMVGTDLADSSSIDDFNANIGNASNIFREIFLKFIL
jgi:hypothetical protein